MKITVSNDFFRSSDGKNEIGYNVWRNEETPLKAVFQIVHGMAEHIDRYDHFARYLVENGYAVVGNNHLGHGNSVKDKEDLGHIEGRDGYKNMAKDARQLTAIARDMFSGAPVILFGHSMGSFVSRYYAHFWSDAIDGLVLCGTAGKNRLASVGLTMIDMIAAAKGERHKSTLIDNMAFGSYNKKFEKRTKFDWISANPENVDAYIADEYSGQAFTLSAFRNLMTLLKTITKDAWSQTVRKDLPILLIAGKDDPVGNYGKGVVEAANQFRSAGVRDVRLVLYDGMRHEILNEIKRQTVYKDVLKWANGVAGN